MNTNDKKRIAGLLREQFTSLKRDLRSPVTKEEIEKTSKEVLKELGLTKSVFALTKHEASAKDLREALSRALMEALGRKVTSRDRCGCLDDYEDLLKDLVEETIERKRNIQQKIDLLEEEFRTFFARVEVAEDAEDLKAIMKDAGLLV